MISDQKSALQVVKKILAADFACQESNFDEEGLTFHYARAVEGARHFPLPDKFLAVVTMGRGVVIACTAGRMRWVHKNLKDFTPHDLFSVAAMARMEKYVARDRQTIFGPELRYICTQDTFKPYRLDNEIEIDLIRGEGVRNLYENNKFPNALGYQDNPLRPRLLACSANHNGTIVGLAGASADCDSMWQIGIDILQEYRNGGIGKVLVSQLTEALFEMGKLPYYSTRTTNIASRRIAVSLGYRPAWVEIYSREPIVH